ncbi:hypothetical protein [Microtetraspora malaysiensis]|uniref:hypothetical protein n=1 Tax=Microtetraspora malaysiensis TaxID=161358 RepID=UPI003D915A2C
MSAVIEHRTAAKSARLRAAVVAEWIKVRSLRSLPTALLAAAVFSIGLAGLVCASFHARWGALPAERRSAFDPIDTNLGFLQITPVFLASLGALVITSEYGCGLIRGTFVATPQRGLVIAAKALLVGVIGWIAATAITCAAFLLGQGRLAGAAPHVGLGSPGAARAVLGGGLYLTLAALLGMFVGVLARSTAVAVSGVFAILLVLPTMVDNLPHKFLWRHTVPYLPSNLGLSVWHHGHLPPDMARPGAGALGLVAWVVAIAALGTVRVRKRDA